MINNSAIPMIEEGAVAIQLAPQDYDTIVIGGGQAGLSMGYHLARAGVRFLILDAHARIGDAWRKRWDSLRLFTPAKLDGLDGMPFPAPPNYFPTKNEMAEYLEAYARRFKLPVRGGERVLRVFTRGRRYTIVTQTQEYIASNVVVAMSKYQRPRAPAFAKELSSDIVQLHSSDYRNPGQLNAGDVLVAGAGNSGADLALEVTRGGSKVWLAGPKVDEVPFRPESFIGRNIMIPLVLGFVFNHVMTVNTPMGRKAQPGAFNRPVPLIRVKSRDLEAAGVQRVPRVVGARAGKPSLEDGRVLEVRNVLWSSGFHAGFEWIDLPVFDERGTPKHKSGVVEAAPGFYFVGLPFLHAMSSSMIQGVGRDARRIAVEIQRRNGDCAGRDRPTPIRSRVTA